MRKMNFRGILGIGLVVVLTMSLVGIAEETTEEVAWCGDFEIPSYEYGQFGFKFDMPEFNLEIIEIPDNASCPGNDYACCQAFSDHFNTCYDYEVNNVIPSVCAGQAMDTVVSYCSNWAFDACMPGDGYCVYNLTLQCVQQSYSQYYQFCVYAYTYDTFYWCGIQASGTYYACAGK